MSFFGKIGKAASAVWRGVVGSPEITHDVFDKDNGLLVRAGGWIDGLSYTDQEKAQDFTALAKGMQEFVIATLGESTVRSKTRRSIATLWIRFELFMAFASFLLYPVDPHWSRYGWEIVSSQLMVVGTLTVLGFFFGAHMFGRDLFASKKGKE